MKGLIGGLFLGFSIATLLGYRIFYLWPEVIDPILSDWTEYESTDFIVKYKKGAPFSKQIETCAAK